MEELGRNLEECCRALEPAVYSFNIIPGAPNEQISTKSFEGYF